MENDLRELLMTWLIELPAPAHSRSAAIAAALVEAALALESHDEAYEFREPQSSEDWERMKACKDEREDALWNLDRAVRGA